MTAPRTDPPTPDPLASEPDAYEAFLPLPVCNDFETCRYPLGHSRGHSFAALPSAPDQRLREALRHISEDANHSPDFRHAVGSQPHCGPCIAYNTLAALSEATTSPEATLDVAWREAEAALPEGWRLTLGRLDDDYASWSATAVSPAFFEGENDNDADCQTGEAMTPAAALHALAARLRGPA